MEGGGEADDCKDEDEDEAEKAADPSATSPRPNRGRLFTSHPLLCGAADRLVARARDGACDKGPSSSMMSSAVACSHVAKFSSTVISSTSDSRRRRSSSACCAGRSAATAAAAAAVVVSSASLAACRRRLSNSLLIDFRAADRGSGESNRSKKGENDNIVVDGRWE